MIKGSARSDFSSLFVTLSGASFVGSIKLQSEISESRRSVLLAENDQSVLCLQFFSMMYKYFFISNPRSMCELLLIGVSLLKSNPPAMCELMLI